MTRKSHPSPGDGTAARRLDVQRIRVNAQGYDSGGSYWGAGHDVFIATTPDGSEEVTVRARNVSEARKKVAAELARQPGEVRSEHEPIGGNSPHKSRHEIDWVNPVTNRTVRIRITHKRDYLRAGGDHLEIESIKPARVPLPITSTGYRSYFLPAAELADAGGPVAFVTAWIGQEARDKTWTKAAAKKAQGDLFQWAEAQAEVGAKSASRPERATAKPRRKPARGREPG
jgi:hypothetical protein